MDITKLIYPQIPESEKPVYLTYSPGRYPNFKIHKTISLAKASVTRARNKCNSHIYKWYHGLSDHKKMTAAQIEYYNNVVLQASMMIFKTNNGVWEFLPEESFVTAPLVGYPLVDYMKMYYMPVRTKMSNTMSNTVYSTLHMQSNDGRKMNLTPTAKKKVNLNVYQWVSMHDVMEASNRGNVRLAKV